jgi:hypothetical protein
MEELTLHELADALEVTLQGIQGHAYQLPGRRVAWRDSRSYPLSASGTLSFEGKERLIFVVRVGSSYPHVWERQYELGVPVSTEQVSPWNGGAGMPEADGYAKDWLEGCEDPERDTSLLLASKVLADRGSTHGMLKRAHLWLLATHIPDTKARSLAAELLSNSYDFEPEGFQVTVMDILKVPQTPLVDLEGNPHNIGLPKRTGRSKETLGR